MLGFEVLLNVCILKAVDERLLHHSSCVCTFQHILTIQVLLVCTADNYLLDSVLTSRGDSRTR